MKLKDLSEVRRMHLAWRLDHNTGCGYLTACKLARLGFLAENEKEVWEVFLPFCKSDRSAKILAHKVENFEITEIEQQLYVDQSASFPLIRGI